MSFHRHNYAMEDTIALTFPVIGLGKGVRTSLANYKISIKEFDKTSQEMYDDIFKNQHLASNEDVREIYNRHYYFRRCF